MAFVNPILIAAGAGLITVPILLHLIMRQKPKRTPFPALRFVKERIETNQRRMRVRHWLLLLLRCIGVMLIALAYSKPSTGDRLFGTWLSLGLMGFVALLSLLVLIGILILGRPYNRVLFAAISLVLAGLIASMFSVYQSSVSQNPSAFLGKTQNPVSAVILIDTSPRMLYKTEGEEDDKTARKDDQTDSETEEMDGVSRLGAAQKIAKWLIGELPDNSDVSIVDASSAEPYFSFDIAAARKQLMSLKIENDANSMTDRLLTVLELFDEVTDESEENRKAREVYLFTDMTRSSWTSKRSGELKKRLEELPDVAIYLVDVSVENPTNYRLENIELSSSSITPGGQIELTVGVRRLGPPGEREITVELDIPDARFPRYRNYRIKEPETETVDGDFVEIREENGFSQKLLVIDGFTKTSEKFSAEGKRIDRVPLPLGIHHGVIRLVGEDPLGIDNERYFTFEIRQPRRVLLVYPDDESSDPKISNTVESVLAPNSVSADPNASDEKVDGVTDPFQCDKIKQSQILETRLTRYSAVFLLNPAPMSESQWESLNRYAANGNGLAIFLGSNAKNGLTADASFLSEMATKVIGGQLGEVWTDDTELSVFDYGHPLFQPYKRFETENLWFDFPVFRHWGLTPNQFEDSPVTILARYRSGQPAVIENSIGKGSVITVTTPFSEPARVVGRKRWNDLTNGDWWPAAMLIDGIGKYLVDSRSNRLMYVANESVTMRVANELESRNFLLFSPRIQEEPTELEPQDSVIRYPFTDAIGNYRVKTTESSRRHLGFSVNLPVRATDLTRVSDDFVNETFGKDRVRQVRTKEDIIREQSFTREGKKFFPFLLTVFMVIVVVEYLVANRFYRSG